jgi:hypothetical protein
MSFKWPCGKTALLRDPWDTRMRMRDLRNTMACRLLGDAALSTCLPCIVTIDHVLSSSLHIWLRKETRRLISRPCRRRNTLATCSRHQVNPCKTAQNRRRLLAQSCSLFLFPSGSLPASLRCGQSISQTINEGHPAQRPHSPDQKTSHGKPPRLCPRVALHQSARHTRRRRAHSLPIT